MSSWLDCLVNFIVTLDIILIWIRLKQLRSSRNTCKGKLWQSLSCKSSLRSILIGKCFLLKSLIASLLPETKSMARSLSCLSIVRLTLTSTWRLYVNVVVAFLMLRLLSLFAYLSINSGTPGNLTVRKSIGSLVGLDRSLTAH